MSEEQTTAETASAPLTDEAQRRAVRDRYADIAETEHESPDETDSCCESTGCCDDDSVAQSRSVGYEDDDFEQAPDAANLGLGCGNPTAIASLSAGDTVLDLGSGAGFDCFLASQEVGPEGQVIGVDMTPEMIEKARNNASDSEAANVDFRLGEIEHLPVADRNIDVVISNCVVNLSPDKAQVFRDAFRVLKPGGRIAISDVVRSTELPTEIQGDPSSIAACVAGAATIAELQSMLDDVGFDDITIEPKEDSEEFIRDWDPERDLSDYIVSARIEARKPE
jgi:arsenite methyltransferase